MHFNRPLQEWTLKSRVHMRVSHLPPTPELYKANVSSIRSNDVGRLIQVCGTGTSVHMCFEEVP